MSTTVRNRELDPVKAEVNKVVHTGAGNRVLWIGKQVKITLRNGDVVFCQHEYGHRTTKALRACAKVTVDRLNRAAGTSSAEVDAANAKRVVAGA